MGDQSNCQMNARGKTIWAKWSIVMRWLMTSTSCVIDFNATAGVQLKGD